MIETGIQLLGIDVGTSVIKCGLFDATGRSLGSCAQPVSVNSPRPGWAEQDMTQVWDAAVVAIRRLVASAPGAAQQIAGVGVTGQGHGTWPIDESGIPVRQAMLWSDARAADIVEGWQRDGTLTEAFDRSGTLLWPGAPSALMAWLKVNEPGAFAKTRWFLQCKDWIKYGLTGEICSDRSDGSPPFLSMTTGRYDSDSFEALDLADVRQRLAPIVSSSEIIGRVSKSASIRTGLAEGTPVASSALDAAAVALGSGVLEPGQAFSILGTTALNARVMDRPAQEPVGVGVTIHHAMPGRWLRILPAMNGTPNLDWFVDQLGAVQNAEAQQRGVGVLDVCEQALTEVPIGSGGVVYLPFLRGERAPFLLPSATAAFFGIGAATIQSELLRAVYEGVAFSVRDCYEQMGAELAEVHLMGGSTRSRAWCQILADVVGRPMVVPSSEEPGALGAAMMAGVGIGLFSDYAAATSACVRSSLTFEPRQSNAMRYDDVYALYRDLRERLVPCWEHRARVLDRWRREQ